ncbi:MAG: hypothetical protein JST68_27250 [Bacteroidetes bacterium]|nr:hypothetical protein [Bacteroidota bacterium]
MGKYILVLVFLLVQTVGFGQSEPAQPASDSAGRVFNVIAKKGEIKDALPSDGTGRYLLTSKEAVLSFSVLISLFVIIFIEVWLIYKMKIHDDNAVKLIVITVVLMGTLFIVMVGFDDRIVAPVFGLFGTIVGYLFGKSASSSKSE